MSWIALVERLLKAATVRKQREVFTLLKGIVEGQEILSSMDAMLVLRRERPTKRYQS